MAKLRLNPLSSKERDFPHKKDETLKQIFDRFWETLRIKDKRIRDSYVILLDGEIIDRELWETITPNNSTVLISVALRGGSSRPLVKQLLITAAVVAAIVIIPEGTDKWISAGVSAGVGIGASLLVNALLPPIVAGLGGITLGGLDYDDSASQSYNISGQSNDLKKFEAVPKVYGTHRFFPSVVANPYIEIEADPETGELVQMFYCIYDFGLGPNFIYDLKIGETSFGEYNDAFYRLVDLNKPDVNEGDWDYEINKTFTYYKGSVHQTTINAAINSNADDLGATLGEYQAVRSADDSGDGDLQYINLIVIFPNGLTTYATNGDREERSVVLNVEFADTGTEDWKSIGSSDVYFYDTDAPTDYQSTGMLPYREGTTPFQRHFLSHNEKIAKGFSPSLTWEDEDAGWEIGTTEIYGPVFIPVNSLMIRGNDILGKVKSREVFGSGYKYTLYSGIPYRIYTHNNVYRWDETTPGNWTPVFIEELSKTFNVVTFKSDSAFTFSANTKTPVYFSIRFAPKTTAQIDIRLTRERSYGGASFQIVDGMMWSTLLTRYDRTPIITDKRHTFIEVKIKATDQLNGTLQNLSGVVSSVLNTFDGTSWNLAKTNNPAWVFTDLLTGQINKRAIDISKIDSSSILEWANYCDEYPPKYGGGNFDTKRFECNFTLDYKTTLTSMITKVSNSSNAGLTMFSGSYGVLIDKEKTIPVQVFTPRNTSNFSSVRNYADVPHGLKIKYVDSYTDWNVKEVVVYSDGYTEATATEFQEMDTFACTNVDQAWRYGRYMLAQASLRQENMRIDVDFENLVCTRGDYVLFQQDVMKVGGTPARVKTVVGNVITINDSFSGTLGGTYGYTFRGVSEIVTSTLVLDSSDTATVNGTVPSVGDLIIWGEIGQVTMNAIVKSIEPSSDLTATIFLVERANAIHSAESGEPTPIYNPQISTSSIDTAPSAITELREETGWACDGGGYIYFIDLSWLAPGDSVVEIYEIYVNDGSGFDLVGYSSKLTLRYIADADKLDTEYSIKVVGVSSGGSKLSLGEVISVTSTPTRKTSSPSDVESLYINVLNETLQLNWSEVTDCDASFYMIRYSPSLSATWFSSIPLQNVKAGTSMTSVQARTGSYLIKVIDWNGNESDNAALAITSIPNLVNLNIIEETNDFPALTGFRDRVTTFGDQLILQEINPAEYYSEGYYYYSNLLDLGEIYTVRLQALIEAEGFASEDIISSWVTLSDVVAMQTSTISDWNVEAQYRATDEFITMSSWATLTSVAALDSGSADVWTNWASFTVGDFTGRIFQFRLKLLSFKPSSSPRVYDGIIKADMPDRIESYDNIIVPITGYTFIYSPAFKGPGTTPNIQVTQDNAQTGDYYLITSRSLTCFVIKFYDKTDTLVERQADIMIKGYGRKHNEVI